MALLTFYFDEDTTDSDVVSALRIRGVEVITPSESGLFRVSDEKQLSFAAYGGHAIYTFNVGDYCRLHAQWLRSEREHAGIIIGVQQKFSVGEQVRRVLRLRAEKSAAEMRNQIENLRNWG